MYLNRTMKSCWTEAGEQFPVLLLTGPRQVGKTTLLQHLCGKQRRYVTLDDPTLRSLAIEDPALFLHRFSAPMSYASGRTRRQLHHKMLLQIARQINHHPFGRVEPRLLKRSTWTYGYLREPRWKARLKCLSSGH